MIFKDAGIAMVRNCKGVAHGTYLFFNAQKPMVLGKAKRPKTMVRRCEENRGKPNITTRVAVLSAKERCPMKILFWSIYLMVPFAWPQMESRATKRSFMQELAGSEKGLSSPA